MNYKVEINYDGTQYKGFAKQPNEITVQGVLENAIEKIAGENAKTTGCGRTDAGVHALNQTVSFSLEKDIEPKKFARGLNAVLPQDIRVKTCKKVSEEFSARFSAKGKIYEYHFVKELDSFNYKFALLLPTNFNFKAVKKAIKYLVGRHDFKSFSVAKTQVKDFVKTIYYIKIIKRKNQIIFRFKGSGFLHNMVRIIMGTLIDVGTQKITPKKVKEILEAKDRRLAGKTAPAHALFLVKAIY